MSVLAATAGAQVIAFEPNPELQPILRAESRRDAAKCVPSRLALYRHTAALIPPDPAEHNNGLGRLGDRQPTRAPCPFRSKRSMRNWQGRAVAILKIDVEGAEQAVLEGAANALNERRVRHIIFEDHRGRRQRGDDPAAGPGIHDLFHRMDAQGTGAWRSRTRCQRMRDTKRRAISRRWHP